MYVIRDLEGNQKEALHSLEDAQNMLFWLDTPEEPHYIEYPKHYNITD